MVLDLQFLHMETGTVKLKALVYDILRPASAISDYTIGVQMAVSLRKITQIMSGISFITACVAYASTNKTKTIRTEKELFFFGLCLHTFLDAMLLPQSY